MHIEMPDPKQVTETATAFIMATKALERLKRMLPKRPNVMEGLDLLIDWAKSQAELNRKEQEWMVQVSQQLSHITEIITEHDEKLKRLEKPKRQRRKRK